MVNGHLYQLLARIMADVSLANVMSSTSTVKVCLFKYINQF